MTLPSRPIERVRSGDDVDGLVGSYVDDRPADLTEAGIYHDAETGEPIIAYFPYPGDVAVLRRAVLGIPWNRTYRSSSGTKNVSKVFGMSPRKLFLQRESCRPTALAHEEPEIHAELENTATLLARWTEDNLPEVDRRDREAIEPVLPEWRIGEDTIWTSGVVNLTSQLPYHRDGSNFQSWSAMPVVRRETRGGYLHVPEYDATIGCRDGWVVYFAGWKYVHGVTPIRKITRDGYRISIVLYSLRGMKDCHTFAVETARGTRTRTVREETMLRGSPFDPEPAA